MVLTTDALGALLSPEENPEENPKENPEDNGLAMEP
jgi:hypothetical protein